MDTKDKKYVIIYLIIVFLFLTAFFVRSYPAPVFNTDDWCFITDTRHAFPVWKALNPCRVLPEILAPAATWIAMHFIYPITGDIVSSIPTMAGILLGLSITAYTYFAYRAIKNRFKFNTMTAVMLSLLFLVFHFAAFRKNDTLNTYAFYSISLTHVYFYTLPNILNGTLLLYFLGKDDNKVNGLICLLVYIALLSNLYASIVLPVLFSIQIIFQLFRYRKINLKDNWFKISVICFWAVVQLFEINGGRAMYLETDASFIGSVLNNIADSFSWLYHNVNHLFLFFSVAVVITAVVIYIVKKEKETLLTFLKLALSLIITAVYILLVATKAGYSMTYSGIFFEAFTYAAVFVVFSICSILKKYDKLELLLPIACLIFMAESTTSTKTFAVTSYIQSAEKLDNYIIDCVIEADENGEDSVEIKVPDFGGYDNFPLATYGGGYVSRFLYKYGITSQYVYAEFIPDSSLNEEFNL